MTLQVSTLPPSPPLAQADSDVEMAPPPPSRKRTRSIRTATSSSQRSQLDDAMDVDPPSTSTSQRRSGSSKSLSELQTEWQDTLGDDVALITIDSPTGEVPAVPPGFKYLESCYLAYVYSLTGPFISS